MSENLFVIKRNGHKELVKFDKIIDRINNLISDDEKRYIDSGLIAQKVIGSIYSGISTEELDIESAKICANFNTTHPLYNNLAGRILVSNLHKKTDSKFVDKQIKLLELTKTNEFEGIISKDYLNFLIENKDKLEQIIDYNRDFLFDYFGFKTLERSYLLKNPHTKEIIERPQDMWMRVACFLNRDINMVQKTYNALSKGFYTHATPTLFNSGTNRANLSSCFLLGTEDSIDGITDTWKQVSKISKWSGGIGLHVSNIRSKGSIIRGTNGVSDGIIPMLQVYNNIGRYVNQCFVPETIIYTNNGSRKICDIRPNIDRVITHDGTYKNVLETFEREIDEEILLIKTEKGELKCTKVHQIMVDINKYVNAENLNVNDNLLFPNEMNITNMEKNKILEIQKLNYKGKVYDLNVESNHNYLTNCGIVHNSGKRKGSIAIYLEPHHPDIEHFLDLKKNFGAETERARDLFYALWISDVFMKQVETDGDWYLLCPDECRGLNDVYGEEYEKLYWLNVEKGNYRKKLKARELFRMIMDAQIETGTPYMLYKDACNRKCNQKNIGTIKSSNLCAEITLFSDDKETAVCNLSSIAVSKFVKEFSEKSNWEIVVKENCKYCRWAKNYFDYYNFDYKIVDLDIKNYDRNTYPLILHNNKVVGGFDDLLVYTKCNYDYKELYETSYLATVNLDKVIDINYYPTNEAKKSNLRHRPIGLGIQGLADTLVKLRIPFESEEALLLNKKILETIYYASLKASIDLSKGRKERVNKFIRSKISIPEYYSKELILEDKELNKIYHELRLNSFEIKEESEYSGSYSSFKGSPFSEGKLQIDMWGENEVMYNFTEVREDIKKYGIRNSMLTALMPTASTSQILGNNECFEFYTNNIYNRKTLAGDFVLMNKHLVNDLGSIGEWNYDIKQLIIANDGSVNELDIPKLFKNLYKTIWEIKQIWVLKAAKARGPYIDQTQSMNIFMAVPDFKKLFNTHLWGWKNGLKTGMYYLRSKPSRGAIKFTVDPKLLRKKRESIEEEVCESCSA